MNNNKEEIKGWLNINKELGISSHTVVSKVRRALSFKKVGHAGTLDPLATGVMTVAVGRATRLIQFLTETKKYVAGVKLGVTTTTLDSEGEITSQNEVNVSQKQLLEVINTFVGNIEQIPPMYSSVHHNGQRLYELARKGIEVERKSRKIEIYYIKLLEFNSPDFKIEISCESGTYIRTLSDDIGRKLGCGAYMSSLERIESNKYFSLENSIKAEDSTKEDLLPLDYPLKDLPSITLQDPEKKRYLVGQRIKLDFESTPVIRVYDEEQNLLGIASLENNLLVPKVNLL
ncbi:MAG: tRNA pseudouridine(55) synthase TruB [Candidatus Sericytochromatia bacterium]